MLLEVKNLVVSIGTNNILRGVSFNVDSGEVIYLVGRNGAGKTTILKSILGYLPIKSGEIIYEGKNITNLKPHLIARMGIGYSPEDRRIFLDLTVRENIKVAIKAVKNIKKHLNENEVFERIYFIFPWLRKLENRRGIYLSGGEQKMLAIARALALNPKLMLLDEPFEGLSPVTIARLREGIEKIRQQGISMIISESNFNLALKNSNKIYVIERGEVIYEGNADNLYNNESIAKIFKGYIE